MATILFLMMAFAGFALATGGLLIVATRREERALRDGRNAADAQRVVAEAAAKDIAPVAEGSDVGVASNVAEPPAAEPFESPAVTLDQALDQLRATQRTLRALQRMRGRPGSELPVSAFPLRVQPVVGTFGVPLFQPGTLVNVVLTGGRISVLDDPRLLDRARTASRDAIRRIHELLGSGLEVADVANLLQLDLEFVRVVSQLDPSRDDDGGISPLPFEKIKTRGET
jgi:hypothetical protein